MVCRIEDDPYGQLRYEGAHLEPLVVLDGRLRGHERAPYSGNVLYLSTFSKILAPGLRLGWIWHQPKSSGVWSKPNRGPICTPAH
jgi:2-aminoadipate transaminase